MAAITASEVKKLREMTGAGMMDSKKALTEAEGNIDKAVEILRKKGQKLSVKRAERDAKEGVVIAKVGSDKKNGIVIRLSCETDFVAKNEGFIELAEKIAEIALKNLPETLEELKNIEFENGLTIEEKTVEQVGVIGEKIEVADYAKLSGEQIVSYIHMGYKAGVILALSEASDKYEEAGRNVAMQVAAMKPIALSKDEVDPSVIDKEIEIGKEQALAEGKPEHIVEKIAMGKLNKFFADNTLLSQTYVKDNSLNVEKYLDSVQKGLTVTGFRHVTLG